MALQPVWHRANQAIIWTNFGSILIEALSINENATKNVSYQMPSVSASVC